MDTKKDPTNFSLHGVYHSTGPVPEDAKKRKPYGIYALLEKKIPEGKGPFGALVRRIDEEAFEQTFLKMPEILRITLAQAASSYGGTEIYKPPETSKPEVKLENEPKKPQEEVPVTPKREKGRRPETQQLADALKKFVDEGAIKVYETPDGQSYINVAQPEIEDSINNIYGPVVLGVSKDTDPEYVEQMKDVTFSFFLAAIDIMDPRHEGIRRTFGKLAGTEDTGYFFNLNDLFKLTASNKEKVHEPKVVKLEPSFIEESAAD